MASAGSIFVDLMLRDAKYTEGLNRARNSTKKTFGAIQGDLGKTGLAFNGVLNPVNNLTTALTRLGGTIAATLSVQRIVQYSDSWRQLEGRLLIVEANMNAVGKAQEDLFEIAQRNRQPLEGVISFYQRLNQFIPEAERNQYDLLAVTERVTAALAITGETGASSTAAMIQFTQAIGTNFESAGQELRSIQEQAPRLAQALRNSFGDGTKSLQQLKEEGILTRDSVLRALGGMGEEGRKLAAELEKIPLTVGQAFTRLNNAFLKFIGQSAGVTKGTSALSLAISRLAENLDKVANAALTLAAVFTTKLILSIGASTVAWVANQIAIQSALVSLAATVGISTAAATAQLALGAALRTVALALKGFVVIGALAFIYELIDGNESLIAKEKELSGVINQTASNLDKVYQTHGKLTDEAVSQVNDRIEAYKKEVQALELVLRAQLDNRSQVGLMLRGLRDTVGENALEGLLGIEYESLTETVKKQDAYNKSIRDLNDLLTKNREIKKTTNGNGASLLNTSETQGELKELSEATQRWGIDVSEVGIEAANNIQNAFAEFFFNPFEGGLKGMLRNFIDTLRRMAANAAASNLMKMLFGEENKAGARTGGALSGVLGGIGSLFGGFFADGGFLSPGEWGIAGENGPEPIFGGSTGMTVIPNGGDRGNVYNIDARGTDPSVVRRIEASLLALAGPGVTEARTNEARIRGMA